MNVETEIKVIKAQIEYLTKAYNAGLIVNALSFLGILATLISVVL